MKFKNTPVITTKRLCLRAIEEKDQAEMLELFMNPVIAKTYLMPDFASKEDAIPLFERFRELSVSDDRFVYGICLNDKVIGWVNDVSAEGSVVELGYVIDPAHHNQGYATEMLQAAMVEVFASGYTVVKTGAFEDNTASIRVMEKNGMQRIEEEEYLEYRGKKHRCVYYIKESK